MESLFDKKKLGKATVDKNKLGKSTVESTVNSAVKSRVNFQVKSRVNSTGWAFLGVVRERTYVR